MKSSINILGILSLASVVLAGCYTEEHVVREPAGAPVTTRTTVRETVTVDEPSAPVTVDTVRVPATPARVETVTVPAPTATRVETIIVPDAPPAPRVETVTVAPSGGHVWVPGHWTREGDRWVWTSGRYELRPTPTAVYVPGHWENQGTGYVWREGYWK